MDKDTWRILLGGQKAAGVTGSLPTTREGHSFPSAAVFSLLLLAGHQCVASHRSLAPNFRFTLWKWVSLLPIHCSPVIPPTASHPMFSRTSCMTEGLGANEGRSVFASGNETKTGIIHVMEPAQRHLPTPQLLPWYLTERALWINIYTKHSQEWEFMI